MGLKQLCRRVLRAVMRKDNTPSWFTQESEKRAREEALKAFFARRGVSWPRRRPQLNNMVGLLPKVENRSTPRINNLGVRMGNLYPDLSEFY